jgi:hypothetical protein
MAAFAGCSVVSVTEKATGATDVKKAPGLPFYVKRPQYTHTTVYRRVWLRATLGIETALKPVDTKAAPAAGAATPKTQTIVRDFPKGSDKLEAIKLDIIKANSGVAGKPASDVIAAFRAEKSIGEDAVTPIPVKNVVATEWVVDSSKTYYLNATMPWFGSANLTQKVNADGTLSETTSSPDTKLADGLSALIPFKEFLTGKFVKSGTAAAADPATSTDAAELLHSLNNSSVLKAYGTGGKPLVLDLKDTNYTTTLTLSVEEVGYEYALSTLPSSNEIRDLQAIPFADKDKSNFTVTAIGAKKEDKNDETPKIGISGSIDLPKEWAAAKP